MFWVTDKQKNEKKWLMKSRESYNTVCLCEEEMNKLIKEKNYRLIDYLQGTL